jgi:S1-C subfamily serine protease
VQQDLILARWGACRRSVMALCLVLLAPFRAHAAATTQQIFEEYGSLVVQIRVVEAESGAKSSIGTGFVATAKGHIVTNFHVVSQWVEHPDRYRGELVLAEAESHPVEILAIDVVNDLAVLSTSAEFRSHLSLAADPPQQGVRLYSLGNPFDLGQSIVEGTYNGLLEHSSYERIHFTGSLNPGMSGGPTLTADGEVAGVNVATSGNQISFLVPAQRLRALLDHVGAREFRRDDDLNEAVRRQLLERQQTYLDTLLSGTPETVQLGHYRVPSKLAPFFECWGDRQEDDDDLYEILVHQCSTDDSVFISRDQHSAIVALRHRRLASTRLGAERFYELYSASFEGNHSQKWGRADDFSAFRCRTGFVENSTLTFKTTFCVRRYRRFEGLYDAVFKAATLGESGSGLETALVLSAVSFESAERLARRYLEEIAWVD